MTISIDNSIAAAFNAFKRLDGREVTYSRGASAVTLTALIDAVGRETFGSGNAVRTTLAFAFWADELKFSGTTIEPQRGDRIALESENYEVVNSPNECPFDMEEAGRKIITVIAQKINV